MTFLKFFIICVGLERYCGWYNVETSSFTVGEFFLREIGFGSTTVRLDEKVARVFSVSQS